ncbi:MAG: HlyD family efflux transporter periplasmic adaptor subunit [Planctomycetes bacterium]|nr:HlyD family efflux transporter periplasmic adaptor subunit [Planctomycetota bacterium]
MKKPSRRTIAILVTGAVVAAVAFWPREKPQKVYVASVERLPELKAVVNGSGEIRTEDSVDIQAEIAGVIVELPVREGDRVKKDQVLLKIDPFQTEAEVLSARSSLSALEAEAAGQAFQIATSEANAAREEYLKKAGEVELRQAQVNLSRAQMEFNRNQQLHESKVISPDQLEVSETSLKVNQAQVDAALARIEQLEASIKAAKSNIEYARKLRDSFLQRVEGARSSLRRSEDLLGKTTIRSPLDGVVVKRNVEAGERAVPGILSNPQATLMTIADLSVIEAELKIDETDIINVKIADLGKVVVDALPEAPLAGRVIEIGNSPILTLGQGGSGGQEGKDFKVVLRIDHPPDSLRPGMSCEADITTAVRKNPLVIPIQALTLREVPVDREGRYLAPKTEEKPIGPGAASAESSAELRKEMQGVFIAGKDGRARFRPVKTGITGESDIEALEGLELGEEVIIGPLKALRGLKDGDRIEVDRSRPYRRVLGKRAKDAAEKSEEEGEKR